MLMADEGASPQIAEAINIVRSLRDGQGEARNALLDWLTHAQQPTTTNVPTQSLTLHRSRDRHPLFGMTERRLSDLRDAM